MRDLSIPTYHRGFSKADFGDAFAPGDCFVHKWLVNEDSAPDSGSNTKMWACYSFINIPVDLGAGLMNPQIVYSQVSMKKTITNCCLIYN